MFDQTPTQKKPTRVAVHVTSNRAEDDPPLSRRTSETMCHIAKGSKFDSWTAMAKTRKRLTIMIVCVGGIIVFLKMLLSRRFFMSLELFAVIIFGFFWVFPLCRENRNLVIGAVVCLQLYFVLGSSTIFQFLVTESTYWYALDLERSREQESIVPCAIRIVCTPIVIILCSSRLGLPARLVTCTGLVMIIAAALTLIGMSLFLGHSSGKSKIVIVIWGLLPVSLALWFVRDHEKQMAALFELAGQVEKSVLKELEAQRVAVENQQRTVGYIFHEVRNPINSVMLASELTLDLLASHPRSYGLFDNPPPNRSLPPSISTPQQHDPSPLVSPQPNLSSLPLFPQLKPFLQSEDTSTAIDWATLKLTIPSRGPPNSVADMPTTTSSSTTAFTTITSSGMLACTPGETAVLEETRKMVEDIYQSTKAAVRVLNDALNLQKLQSGAFEFVMKPFLLKDLLLFSTRMVQPQMRRKRIEFRCSIDRKLEDIGVEGDFHRLQQVLLNYLNNACKFTPIEGTVEVRMQQVNSDQFMPTVAVKSNSISVITSAAPAPKPMAATMMTVASKPSEKEGNKFIRVRVSVYNTGEAIQEESKPKIFTPWSQIRSGEQQEGHGSGLGLALCKAFVERGHNGVVGFESQPRLGTEFFFEISFKVCTPPTTTPDGQRHFRRVPTTASSDQLTPGPADAATSSSSSPVSRDMSSPDLPSSRWAAKPLPLSTRHPAVQLETEMVVRVRSPLIGAAVLEIDNNNDNNNNNNNNNNDNDNTNNIAVNAVRQRAASVQSVAAPEVDVLVVDDSAMTRRLLVRTLRGMGVSTDQAADGQEAVEKIEKFGIGYCGMIMMDKEATHTHTARIFHLTTINSICDDIYIRCLVLTGLWQQVAFGGWGLPAPSWDARATPWTTRCLTSSGLGPTSCYASLCHTRPSPLPWLSFACCLPHTHKTHD